MNTSSENSYKCLFYGILFIFLTIILLLLLNKKKEKYTCVPSISITPANSSHIIQVDPNTGDLSEINTNSILNAVNQIIDCYIQNTSFVNIVVSGNATLTGTTSISNATLTGTTSIDNATLTNSSGTFSSIIINDYIYFKQDDGSNASFGLTNNNQVIVNGLFIFNDVIGITPTSMTFPDGSTNSYYIEFLSPIEGAAPIGNIAYNINQVVYNNVSDYRLKNNIKHIYNPLERCLKLKPVNYTFISDKNNTIHDGFIAHEVQDILPNIVTGKKDDTDIMQSIDYSKFTPLLTGAIQELYKIIEKQSNDIQELYKIIEKQSNDNKEIKYTLEHLIRNNKYKL